MEAPLLQLAKPTGDGASPLSVLRRYVAYITITNLVWEFVQLPLYTLWASRWSEIVFAAIHCAGGDVLIALSSLGVALLIVRDWAWPRRRYREVALAATASGILYTVFSEWLNTRILGTWAYSNLMPVIPVINAGLSPLAQWIVLPVAVFYSVHPRIRRDQAASPSVVDAC